MQANSKWEDRTEVKKGNFGEKIIHEYLKSKGFMVYEPSINGAHGFDKLAVRNKKEIIIAECKTKARRNYYADTGFDLRHYNEYKFVQDKHHIHVFIFFIDEGLGKIYGNFIKRLEKPIIQKGKYYPSIETGYNDRKTIYFPMCNMLDIKDLTNEQVMFLKNHSSRSYEYALNEGDM